VANRDLWERLLEVTKRHQEVRWSRVKGHSKTAGLHKTGNDRVTGSPWLRRRRRTMTEEAANRFSPKKEWKILRLAREAMRQ
jgi:hypothetical protein